MCGVVLVQQGRLPAVGPAEGDVAGQAWSPVLSGNKIREFIGSVLFSLPHTNSRVTLQLAEGQMERCVSPVVSPWSSWDESWVAEGHPWGHAGRGLRLAPSV